ncbi:hypothetical protein SK128_028039, partial [Halocaridina rubra]
MREEKITKKGRMGSVETKKEMQQRTIKNMGVNAITRGYTVRTDERRVRRREGR